MDSNIIVRLQQGTTLLPGMGFVAMYSAMDGMCRINPDTVHRLFEGDGSGVNYTQVIYDYYKQDVVSQYIWHILVAPNKLIEFKVEADRERRIYDGPGPLSPVLYNSTRSSAYHLYIATQNPDIVLKYNSVEHTLFSTDKSVLHSSVLGKNIVHVYKVKGGTFGLRINFLSIHSHNIDSDIPMRCMFGGLFLYIYKYNSTFEVPICDTDWKEEVFFHLTDEIVYPNLANSQIIIILYDGYTSGKVALSVESTEPCYFFVEGLGMHGCQYHYALTPDGQLYWSYNFLSPGPLNLNVHILPALYNLHDVRFNISVMDANMLGIYNTIRTDYVGTHINIPYQNPTSVIIKEIHRHQFTTWRIAILKFTRMAVCDHKHINQKYHYLKGAQQVTMQPFLSGCQIVMDGHLQYSVVIVASDTNINVALKFTDSCKAECHEGNITVIEYNLQYDRLIVHRFKSFPVLWDNIHSMNTVFINMTVTDNCKRCPVWIVSIPGWQHPWFETVKRSSNIKKSEAFLPVEHPTRYKKNTHYF